MSNGTIAKRQRAVEAMKRAGDASAAAEAVCAADRVGYNGRESAAGHPAGCWGLAHHAERNCQLQLIYIYYCIFLSNFSASNCQNDAFVSR